MVVICESYDVLCCEVRVERKVSRF